MKQSLLKATPLKYVISFFGVFLLGIFTFSGVAFGSWLEGAGQVLNAWDQIANRYFYAAMALWPAMFLGLGRMRQGQKLTPAMSKATAFSMYTINGVCLLFIIVHFSPEMTTVFDYIRETMTRIF